MKRILNIITTLIVAAVVLVAISMLCAKFFGAGTYVVQSGSMEPEYHTGSLIFDKKVDVNELKAGDVITFSIAEDMTATHRIVKVITLDDTEGNPDGASDMGASSLQFRTKGDANEEEDALPVDSRNVIGSPVFQIPYLGYVINFLKTFYGKIAAGAVILLLLAGEVITKGPRKTE